MPDQYCCCRRGDTLHVVMLRKPISLIAQSFSFPRESNAAFKCITWRAVALNYVCQIENRYWKRVKITGHVLKSAIGKYNHKHRRYSGSSVSGMCSNSLYAILSCGQKISTA